MKKQQIMAFRSKYMTTSKYRNKSKIVNYLEGIGYRFSRVPFKTLELPQKIMKLKRKLMVAVTDAIGL